MAKGANSTRTQQFRESAEQDPLSLRATTPAPVWIKMRLPGFFAQTAVKSVRAARLG
jgi:hypothetical protein